MIYELFEIFARMIQSITAPVAGIFAAIFAFQLLKLRKSKDLYRAFGIIALGFIFWGLGEITATLLLGIGLEANVSIADIFWSLGSILVMIGFIYLLFSKYRKHGTEKKELVTILITAAIATAIFIFILINYIIKAEVSRTLLDIIVNDYFYPITSIIIFVAAIAVYLIFRRTGEEWVPLRCLVVTSIFYFVADMVYALQLTTGTYGIVGAITDSLYIIGDIFAIIAFYRFDIITAKDT